MKKIIAFLGAFALAFCSVASTPCMVHNYTVSALVSSSSTVYITNGFTNISNFTSYEQQFLNAHIFPVNSFQVISERSGVNSGILSFDINSMHNWGVVSSENEQYVLYVNRASRSSPVDYLPTYMDYQGNVLSLESQTFFVSLPVSANGSAYLHNFPSDLLNGSNAYLDTYSDENIAFWGVSNGNYECLSKSYNTRFVSYTLPNTSTALSLGIDEVGFYNWLVQTTKDSSFVSYFPLSSLSQYISFYDVWGSAPQKFLMLYNNDFGDNVGEHLTNIQIIELKNLTDKLYREYLNSLKYPSADFPARDRVDVRKDIDTNTTDNNTVLITDDSNDTVIISILRDILRGIIAMRNQIFVTGSDIITGLDNIDFTVNVANNGSELASNTDLSVLWRYDYNDFDDDLSAFALGIEDVQDIPQGYIDTINQNALMPENMLSDKSSLTVNVPCITGFTIGANGSTYSTQTGTYALSSSNYPWLDPIVQKIKRFGSIILIIGYLVHLRFRIPDLVRGE